MIEDFVAHNAVNIDTQVISDMGMPLEDLHIFLVTSQDEPSVDNAGFSRVYVFEFVLHDSLIDDVTSQHACSVTDS